MSSVPSKDLVVKPNPKKDRRYRVNISSPEFTCLCPMTSQPDFATIYISYEPAEYILELKSLKLYLWTFREEGCFHEAVINQICDDLVHVLKPHWLEVKGDFLVRGGISTNVVVEYKEEL